jgi:hypothetical protein
MGLFDAFTGKSAEDAAAKNAALYQQYGQQSAGLLGQASSIYGRAGATASGQLTDYGNQAQQALAGGLAPAEGAIRSSIEAYTPLSALGQKYGAGSTLYQDALGINGPEGVARAKAAFTTGPGYEFQVNEATDAAARNAAKLGLAGSGNTLDAIRSRAQGIASGEYGQYLDRLGGFINPELQATSGAASGTAAGYRDMASLYPQLAGAQANLLTNLGQSQAGLTGTVAGEQAGLLGSQVNVLGNVAGGQANANQQAAQAAQQGSQNFWNGLLNLGSAGVRGYFGTPGRAAA